MDARRAAKNTRLVKVETRAREPRRVAKSPEPLTQEQRVQEAVKIIGKGSARRADIEVELFRFEQTRDALARIRTRGSKATVRALRTLGAALRRANATLPYDFRLLLGIDQMIWNLEVYEATLGNTVASSEKLKEWLEDLEAKKPGMSAAEKWKEWLETKPGERPNLIDVKPGKPKPDAYAKRMASLSAMYLCEKFGIALTTTRATIRKTGEKTKASVFCRLAAVLYGNENADLQHYCRELVQKRRSAKPGQR